MQLSNDRQVNEKSFKIGMNSQNFARFDPLSWEKIAQEVEGLGSGRQGCKSRR
jgi:hypothetical protein